MNEEKIVVNGMELFARYQVTYKDAGMVKAGMGYWVLPNDGVKAEGWVAQHTFKTHDEAVAALNKFIRSRSRGARVETDRSSGIGVDIVIDEDLANDMRVVEWKIRKQWKTRWETIGERVTDEEE